MHATSRQIDATSTNQRSIVLSYNVKKNVIAQPNDEVETIMNHNNMLSWTVPLAIFIITALLSGIIDMPIEREFYDASTGTFMKNGAIDFLFAWGVVPGQVVGVCSLLALALSYVRKSLKPWRKPAMLLVLTMSIGAGFITHTLLKDRWGRPRPRQVVEFGGHQEFRAIYEPNFFDQPEPSKSFPCGHCTMGFFFFTFLFLGRRHHLPWLYYSGIFLTTTLGISLALMRMMQGAHFFSDTVSAAVVMWLTALACDWLVYGDED